MPHGRSKKQARAKVGDSWDESAHPRAPKGQAGGGRFTGGEVGGVDQGEVGSGWHPEHDNAYVGRKVDEARFGIGGTDATELTEEEQDFLDNYGEEFAPVLGELWHEYDVNQEVVENFMSVMNLEDATPQAVLDAFHGSYVGSFDDNDAAAENFLHETYPKLPKGLTDTVSRSDLADSLFSNKGSPYISIDDDNNGNVAVFKRAKMTTDGEPAPKPLAFEVDSVSVIGVNDASGDEGMLVLDEGANMHRSPDGYLVAAPRIARTGIQLYKGFEMGVPDKETVKIYRPEDEVFNLDSLRSYAHKPVTMDHPREAVTSDNWRKYAIGQTADEVLRDGGFIRIPITIMDGDAIKDIEEGKRELSLGYTMSVDWTPGRAPDGEAYDGVQRGIRANHLAIVAAARGGSKLRIGDSRAGELSMKTITVDGASVQVDDVAAAIIPKHIASLEGSVASLTTRAKTAEDGLATLQTSSKKDIETRDAEIVTLKKQLTDSAITPAKIEQLVRDRAQVVAQAHSVLGDKLVTDNRTDSDIRRQVVDAAMGAAAKGWTDDQVSSSFTVLTKDARIGDSTDPLRSALSNPTLQTADASEQAYDEYTHNIGQAHLPEARRTAFKANSRPGFRQ